jgi:hypothetical protein
MSGIITTMYEKVAKLILASTNRPGMVAHAYNPRYQEAEISRIKTRGQPG